MIDNHLEQYNLKILIDFVGKFHSLQSITDDARQRIVGNFIEYTKSSYIHFNNFNLLALLQINDKVKNYIIKFNEDNDKILILKRDDNKDNLSFLNDNKDEGIIILEVLLKSGNTNIENNPCAAFLIQNHLIHTIFSDSLCTGHSTEVIQLKEILDSFSKESFKNGKQSEL